MNVSEKKHRIIYFTIIATMTIIVEVTFNSCGYGDGDKHSDIKYLLSLNSYPGKFRLIRIKTDKEKLYMTAWENEYANPSDCLDYNNDIYRVFPGKDSWYYVGRYDDTFFDCNMEIFHISFKDICGSEDFKLYPLEAGKIYIDVYSNESHKSRILLFNIDTRNVYQQFEYINPSFIGNILRYMKSKGDTLRNLNPLPPLFCLEPESYSRYEKEIKLFHKIYPQAQRDILQLIDKHRDDYVSTEGNPVKSFDYNKVYYDLMSRLQYGDSTASSNKTVTRQQYRQLFFINHSVAIDYESEWKPDSLIPSLSNFEHVPVPQNLANVELYQFDYSLVWQSIPHLLKGSGTRDELYYYNISIGSDTLQLKYPNPLYLFESRRLKNGKVVIALSTKEFKSKDYSKETSDDLPVTDVFFLLYDPGKVNQETGQMCTQMPRPHKQKDNSIETSKTDFNSDMIGK